MAGRPKPSAREAFNDNLKDAEVLVSLACVLRNQRQRRLRREMREKLGTALNIRKGERDSLDCIENDDLFVVFKPGSTLDRDSLGQARLQPLLRQALVAACAAVETFVCDRVMERLNGALNAKVPPTRLLDLPMTVGDWLRIEGEYKRRKWGIRELIDLEVRKIASPAPSQIGIALGIVGEKDVWRRVDARRRVSRGDSEERMSEIYERRNRIAHRGDRVGVRRASIHVEEVKEDLRVVAEVVDALDRETSNQRG